MPAAWASSGRGSNPAHAPLNDRTGPLLRPAGPPARGRHCPHGGAPSLLESALDFLDGGWTNPATVTVFVDYVTKLVTALRDRVRLWNTFNEPDTYASCTYLLGEFPPFHKWRLASFRAVIRHMAEAHLKVCQVIRQSGSNLGPVEVGFSKNWTFFETFQPASPWDRCLAAISHVLFNRFVLTIFWAGTGKTRPLFSDLIIMAASGSTISGRSSPSGV